MNKIKNNNRFIGKFLLATPNMLDHRFQKSVVYICSHHSEGSMGIIINKPAEKVDITKITSSHSKGEDISNKLNLDIYIGGPVEPERGFILHKNKKTESANVTHVKDNIHLTSNIDILNDIINGKGPEDYLIAIGYAGWDSGQLEHELYQNSWIESDSDKDIIFAKNNSSKWQELIEKCGMKVNDDLYAKFSTKSGRA